VKPSLPSWTAPECGAEINSQHVHVYRQRLPSHIAVPHLGAAGGRRGACASGEESGNCVRKLEKCAWYSLHKFGPKDVMMLGFRLDSLNKNSIAASGLMKWRAPCKDADETVDRPLVVRDQIHDRRRVFPHLRSDVKRMLTLPLCELRLRCCVDVGSQDLCRLGGRIPGPTEPLRGSWENMFATKKWFPAGSHSPPHRFAASNLKLKKRGSLKVGYYADSPFSNARTIADHATFDSPRNMPRACNTFLLNACKCCTGRAHRRLARPCRARSRIGKAKREKSQGS